MDEPSFITGFFFGFLISGILGYLLSRIRLERVKAGADRRPMSVLTTKTPAEVRRDSRRASINILGLSILVIIVLIGTVGVIYILLKA